MSIQLNHLTHVYNEGTTFEKVALNDVTLEIQTGEFIGLIGHTGSGKSTLIQHLNGIISPSSGEILLDGENIHKDKAKLKEVRRRIGLAFQYPEYQLFEMTVYKDVAFGPTNVGLSAEQIHENVVAALNIVGIDETFYEKSPFELSGGQKRRVAIAGVLAMNPEVLILDEPTAGLDPKGRDEILAAIHKLHEERGITVILVSHSMEDVARLVDRIIVMHKGKVAMTGTPREIFSHPMELEQMGLAAPQEGRILFHGRPLETEKDFRELRCKVGLVLQHAEDQLFCPTGLEDVAFGPLNLGCTQDEARERAASTLERLGLAGFENRLTHRLSGGEKKLVSLATVLVMEPEALLLDEPTNGLDPEARQRIIGVLKTLPTARIIISHDWDFLAETSSEYLTVEGQHFTDAAPSHAHAHMHVHPLGP